MRAFTSFALAMAVLLGSASASPAPSALTPTKINCTFDDILPPSRIGVFNVLPTPYQHLNWENLKSDNLTAPIKGIPGASLEPNTQPIIVSNSIILESVLQIIPTMSTNYTGSTVKYFDLHSMYIACLVLGLDNSGLDCGITFIGHKLDGSTVTQTCQYTGAHDNVMDLCKFHRGFKHLSSVVMEPQGGLPGKGDTVFDTVSYTIWQ